MPLSEAHTKNLLDMLQAIESCLHARWHVPALVLMYAFIDSMAWVAQPTAPNLRSRFEHWVDIWLMKNLPRTMPELNSTDLYAARCAMLHTGTGVSELFKSGKAKRLLYAWGNAKVDLLEYAIATGAVPVGHVALHYDDLFVALRTAVADFIAAAEHDTELAERLELAGKAQYTNVPNSHAVE